MSEAMEATSMDDVSMESVAQQSESEVIEGNESKNAPELSQEAPTPKKETSDPYETARKVKHKVKVDGKETEVDYDELVKNYELRQAAHKRMEEASQYKKLFQKFQQNPWSIFEEAGLDPDQIAEERLRKKIAYETMSDAERRAYDLEQRAKQLEAERNKYKENYEKYERQQAQAKARETIETDIIEAIEKSGIKPTPRLIARTAELMLAKSQSTGQRASASDVLTMASDHLTKDVREYVTSLGHDELMKVLPKKTLDAIRQAQVEQVVKNSPIGKPKTPQATENKRNPRAKSTDDWFSRLESRL